MSSLSDVVNQGLARIGGARATTPAGSPSQDGANAASATNVQKVAQAGVTVTLTPEGRQAISRMEGFVATLGGARKGGASQKPGSTVDLSI
jgi:hypothetical protein